MPGDRRTLVRESFDAASRAAALDLAAKVGDKRAAAEIGCAEATLRSWRSRAKAAANGPMTERNGTAPADGQEGDADELTMRAETARQDEAEAQGRVRELMTEGRASDARALSQVVKDRSEQASRLEADARAAREHRLRVAKAETALADGMVKTYRTIVRLFVLATGLGWSHAHEALADALLGAFANAERDEHGRVQVAFPEPETTEAREAIDRALRHRYAAEANEATDSPPQAAETSDPGNDLEEDEQTTAAIDHAIEAVLNGEDEQTATEIEGLLNSGDDGQATAEATEDVDPRRLPGSSDLARGTGAHMDVAVSPSRAKPDELPPWYALPEAWKKKYALNPALGRWEYAQALKRERREREEPRRRISSHPDFRHPGLRN